MQDSTLVLISVCAMALLCTALIGGGLFLVLRFTGRTLTEFLGGQSVSEAIDSAAGVEKPTTRRGRTQRLPKTSDLRTQAQSLDFDAAVAKYRNNPNPPPPVQVVPTPTTTTPTPQLDPAPSPKLGDKRRRIRRESEEVDGLLGGFLEDGDDILF
jgi:hypothetical protein